MRSATLLKPTGRPACVAWERRSLPARRPAVLPLHTSIPSFTRCALRRRLHSINEPHATHAKDTVEPSQARLKIPKLQSPAFLGATALAAGAGLMGSGYSLEGPGSVLQAIAVLAAVVTFHECGHFLAARLQGIHVKAFSVGFGPVLWSYKGPQVEYTLRALPLGGYVGFPEDDGGAEFAADDPNLLKNRSLLSRAAVISAGVIANVIFAYGILFAQVNTVGLAQASFLPGVLVPMVSDASAAARAGLIKGDMIVALGGKELPAVDSTVSNVVDQIRASPSAPLDFIISRSGTYYSVTIVPEVAPDGTGRIGVQLSPRIEVKRKFPTSFPEALTLAGGEFKRLGSAVTGGIAKIFTDFSSMAGQLSGPVAIVAAGSEITRADPVGLYQFAAIVNINLAVVNVLPLPALDGGYLLLLALEAVRGKKLPEKLEQGIAASGLLLLMALGGVLVVRDTLNLLPPM